MAPVARFLPRSAAARTRRQCLLTQAWVQQPERSDSQQNAAEPGTEDSGSATTGHDVPGPSSKRHVFPRTSSGIGSSSGPPADTGSQPHPHSPCGGACGGHFDCGDDECSSADESAAPSPPTPSLQPPPEALAQQRDGNEATPPAAAASFAGLDALGLLRGAAESLPPTARPALDGRIPAPVLPCILYASALAR